MAVSHIGSRNAARTGDVPGPGVSHSPDAPGTRRARARTRAVLTGVCAAVAAGGWAAQGVAAGKPRVTVIGDSVQASSSYTPQAVATLRTVVDLRLDARACRRLVAPGCGSPAPSTALQAIQSASAALGRIVVVNVGYNDGPTSYDVPAIRRALRRAGVATILWVNLRARYSNYIGINARIRDLARRDRAVRVVDWNAASRGRPWFTRDGVHLNSTGSVALARLLRTELVAATRPPTPLAPPKDPFPPPRP